MFSFFFSFFLLCAVMSILSFKLGFYMFVLALSLYITIIYLVSIVVLFFSLIKTNIVHFVESYINIYICMHVYPFYIKKKNKHRQFCLLLLLLLSYYTLPSYLLLLTIILNVVSFSLHIFVCNIKKYNNCKYRKNIYRRLIRLNKQFDLN